MEFKSLKNIESSFRQIRLFGIVFLSLCAVITVWSVWSSYRFAERQREKIYVLDNGKSLMLHFRLRHHPGDRGRLGLRRHRDRAHPRPAAGRARLHRAEP